MSFTLCTSGAIVYNAGINVNPAAKVSGALLQQFSNEAEGTICGQTRYDFIANYSKITSVGFQNLLADTCACLAAIKLVQFDMSTYSSRGEAEDIINVLHDRAMKNLKILQDDKLKTTMGAI